MTLTSVEPAWAQYLSDVVPLLGARATSAGTEFVVWTTTAKEVLVELYERRGVGLRRQVLQARGRGVYGGVWQDIEENALYRFVLDDRVLPDPYARALPQGVHGPGEVVQPRHAWKHPRPSTRVDVIYELHVGSFTPEGTFGAAAARLPMLADLGVDTVELMPLSSFAGSRGWGYDGVAHFAPFAGYGAPDDLRFFVDCAHALGMRVILDVVYNHFGPAGNYLTAYSPGYFSRAIRTPWGDGPDFGNPFMRALVVRNAAYWIDEFRFDGLRLDALHAISDPSPTHVVQDIVRAAKAVYAGAVVIGEDERNDRTVVTGWGLDAVFADDFHHQVSVLLTEEREGYYSAYRPSVADLARTIERGWLYEGQLYAPTGRARGTPTDGLRPNAFVYCLDNHDQVGNRAFGNRLSTRCGLEPFVAASLLLLFLPHRVLLFMGQEWGATSPFLYFTDHDPELGRLVSIGRREEFAQFSSFSDPHIRETIPDPQALETFCQSKLAWDQRTTEPHSSLLKLYRTLIAWRRTDPVLADPDSDLAVEVYGQQLVVYRRRGGMERVFCWNLGGEPARPQVPRRPWRTTATSELLERATLAPEGSNLSAPLTPWRAIWLASVDDDR